MPGVSKRLEILFRAFSRPLERHELVQVLVFMAIRVQAKQAIGAIPGQKRWIRL